MSKEQTMRMTVVKLSHRTSTIIIPPQDQKSFLKRVQMDVITHSEQHSECWRVKLLFRVVQHFHLLVILPLEVPLHGT